MTAGAVIAVRGKEWRAAELGRLALRPPGIIALSWTLVNILVIGVVTGFSTVFFLVLTIAISCLVLGWCIGRVVRNG